MTYRYFYNPQGVITARIQYRGSCMITRIVDTDQYVDHDDRLDMAQWRVDPNTQTLVNNTPDK